MERFLEGAADSQLGMLGLLAFLALIAYSIIKLVRELWPQPSALVVAVAGLVFWLWFAGRTVGAAAEVCRSLFETNYTEYSRRACSVIVDCTLGRECDE